MSRLIVTAALAALIVASASLSARCQERGKNPAAGEGEKQKVEVQSVFRMSTITGMPVKNSQGKDLGKIEDLAIELNSGEVRYAALSFGGFASVGDKLFAIPLQAMKFNFGEDDSHFILDVTEDQLERARGFDENKWPDKADPAWAKEGQKTNRAGAHSQAKKGQKSDRLVYDAVYRGANITGMEVKNERNQDLGSVNELVIDLNRGKVRYAALSFGGIAGLGDKLFAIPWTAMRFKHEATDKHFVLHVSPERLKEAEGFDENQWPNVGDPQWGRQIDEFYKTETEREAAVPKRTK